MVRTAATFFATEPRTRLKAWGGAYVLTVQIFTFNDAQQTNKQQQTNLLGENSTNNYV